MKGAKFSISNSFSSPILLLAGLYFFVSCQNYTTKTIIEKGPFQPFGGKRIIFYTKNNIPVMVRLYDAGGNIRRMVSAQVDSRRRITSTEDLLFDNSKRLTGGYKKRVSYVHDLDYVGKTTYQRYDSSIKKFLIVAPLIKDYKNGSVTNLPDSLKLDPFYKKYINANGIPVIASEKVSDAAILIAKDIVNYMLMKRSDIREELIRRKSRVMVMAETEMETDLPERRNWKKPERNDPRLTPMERENYDKTWGIANMSDRQYWNQRARGMGGNEVSCGEENLLGYAGTRYYGENILVHEFSHNIMSAIETTDPALYAEIQEAYQSALVKGLYKNQYAINTVNEYWAEGSQWWFWSNIEFYDGNKRVQSPEDLRTYDPVLYRIFEKVYPSNHIPADIYYSLNLSPVR